MAFKPFQRAEVEAVHRFVNEFEKNPNLSVWAVILVMEAIAGVFHEMAEGEADLLEGRTMALEQVLGRVILREPEKEGPDYVRAVEATLALFEKQVHRHEPFPYVYRPDGTKPPGSEITEA